MPRMFAKAQPTLGDVHVNRPLTDVSVGWVQQQSDFIADRIFPQVPVEKQSDLYFTYSRADFYRSQAQKRAPSTESAGGGWAMGTDNYFADRYSIHKDVDDMVRANSDAPIRVDADATIWTTQQLWLIREIVFMATYFTPGVWTNQTTPGTLWNAAGSTPIQDIRRRIFERKAATGFRPNVLVLGPLVYQALTDHPDVIARVNAGQTPGGPATANAQTIARILDLDRVEIAWAVQNTAVEGATEATSFIAGKHALLAYANPTPSLQMPSAGYIFTWRGLLGAGSMGQRMKKFRMEALESDRIEGDLAFACKMVANECGHFFNGAVS